VWRVLYDVAVLNISLVVSDPNHCAHLTSAELYTAYGHIAKLDTASRETRVQTHKFDQYQSAVASVVYSIATRIKWSALGGAEERSKCIKKLLSLLAWQLARFWDGTKKVRALCVVCFQYTP
jgi:hypothetical protein